MKTSLLFLLILSLSGLPLSAQIDPTGDNYEEDWYYADGPGTFSGSTWQRYVNNTGETVNVHVKVVSNTGISWAAIEGDPGVPKTNGIAPGATFWLAIYSYGSGSFFGYSEERMIMGYTATSGNAAPTIAWTSAPGSAAAGEAYTISARGADQDGNLAQVNVWKDGQPFASAGGGSGTASVAGNAAADDWPGTVTFTAQAVDQTGTTSPTITHVVTISAPANQPPTVTLDSPGTQTVTAGTALTIVSRASDPDGNISNHNLDIQRPAGNWNFQGGFATGEPFQGGPVGSGGDSTRSATFIFDEVGSYTVRAAANDGAGWVHSLAATITVIPAPPPNRAPTIAWISPPGSVGHQQSYAMAARAQDADGNLAQVNVWKNSASFAFTGAGNGATANAGNPSSDDGPQSITYTAQAVDAAGAESSLIFHTVTVEAPPPVQFTLATSAGGGGTVSPGGTFTQGSTALVTATPDAIHDFVGWSGDASGNANPLPLLMDSSKSVQAVFALKSYPLATSATSGGNVTAGGSYPHGTVVTITATAAGYSRFAGWTGDATGDSPSIAIWMNGPRSVQALFAMKESQTITFPALDDTSVGTGTIPLDATASSGLPVSFVLLSGPATLASNELQITAPGAVTIEARQDGNEFYLPAASITQTFNVIAPATIKYRAPSRTFLHSAGTRGTAPFVLEQP